MKLVAVIAGLIYAAASAAIIAAAVEIESIIVTGPTAAIVGLLFALLTAFCRWRMLTAASLSLPILALIVFFIIFLNDWGPGHAQTPITVMLLAYEALAAPLWLDGLWRVVRVTNNEPARWQFPLRSLMAFTFIVALTLGITRLALALSQEMLVAVAVGMFLALMLVLVWLAREAAAASAAAPKAELRAEVDTVRAV